MQTHFKPRTCAHACGWGDSPCNGPISNRDQILDIVRSAKMKIGPVLIKYALPRSSLPGQDGSADRRVEGRSAVRAAKVSSNHRLLLYWLRPTVTRVKL